MKCQILFPGENINNLSSADKHVKIIEVDVFIFFFKKLRCICVFRFFVQPSLMAPAHVTMILIAYMRTTNVQSLLRIHAVSPEPSLLAHT